MYSIFTLLTFRRWLTIFMVCAAVLPSYSTRVVLLDTSKATTELQWATKAMFDHDTWGEETYRGNEGNTNERAYVSCILNEPNVDNWLFTPLIPTSEAKRVHIEASFSLRDCASVGKSCKETFGLYSRVMKHNEAFDAKDFDSRQWKLVDRLTADPDRHSPDASIAENNEVRTETVNGTGIYFAFRDNGACVSLLSVKVYYDVCDAETLDYASFPRTVTGYSVHDVIEIKGECVSNANTTREDRQPRAFCKADGKWQLTDSGSCQCRPGFYASSVTNSCTACSAHTFKLHSGEGPCRDCPSNSASKMGSSHCVCGPGFYRAKNEGLHEPCTKPPTKPSLVRVSKRSQDSVEIEWDEPSYMGGRREVWYRWECYNCPPTVRGTPADAKLSSRMLRLTGLDPNRSYNVMIYAGNEVSYHTSEASYTLVEARTLPIADNNNVTNLMIEGKHEGGVTIAWKSPIGKKHINYQIEIRGNGNTSSMVKQTSHPYITIQDIHPGIKYEFRVRANVDGWGHWSEPLVYDQRISGDAATVEPKSNVWKSGNIGDIPAWVMALVILTLLVMLGFLIVMCRRRTANRKQMSDLDALDTYKQDTMTPDYPSAHRQFSAVNGCFNGKVSAPLIPTYGGSTPKAHHTYGTRFKPYVDPTTYEDPNQALTEFTYDIDPQAVYITSVIGGGEFGDVCMGHLNRVIANGAHGHYGVFDKDVETVAIKTLKPGSSSKAKADFLLEASIMGQFAHPNVITLVGVVTRSEPVMIVTEFMQNGSLDNYLRSRDARGDDLGLPRILEMLRAIAAGMKYLTDKGYVHRDLAARNVLVDDKLNCKIADFGLSRGVDNTTEQEYTTNGGKIPVRWTAPEAITHRKFTAASDVWSFGVLMWEVMSFGERPYWEWTNQKVISEVMLGYRLPAPMDTPMSLHRLMIWCWKLERHERPSFGQLLALLEKYVRNPELVHADASGPRSAHSTHNLSGSGGYGSVNGSSSSHTPPPPSAGPPPPPPLDEFLLSIGLGHCTDRLMQEGINNVNDLARLTHLDLLAFGLISEEYQRIRDAFNTTISSQKRHYGETQTLPHRVHSSRAPGRPAHEQGFFV